MDGAFSMVTTKYAVQNSRREQMKRELIGLVIGTTLLMAGMAFLFSQTLVADGETVSDAKPVMATAESSIMPASPVMAKADIPALASLDLATDPATSNLAVEPVKMTPTPPAVVTPEAKTVVSETIEATATIKPDVPPVEEKVAATATGSTGWIYAGQFTDGKWTEQGLKIGAELPVVGNKYPLAWSATVREQTPSKHSSGSRKLGKVAANLASGSEVEVVQVKKSGTKGHVWLEIRYQ